MQYNKLNTHSSKNTSNSRTSNISIKTLCNSKLMSAGFSLIEVMVTTSIAAIALTIALPNLNDFMEQVRVDNEVTQLNRIVLTARNSAISYEQNVIMCPLVSGECSTDWNLEVSLFIDGDSDGVYSDENDTLLRVKSAITNNDKLTYAGQSSITYTPDGRLSSTASTFIYCPATNQNYARGILLLASGRSYLTSDEDSDGKDNSRNGSNISCPGAVISV